MVRLGRRGLFRHPVGRVNSSCRFRCNLRHILRVRIESAHGQSTAAFEEGAGRLQTSWSILGITLAVVLLAEGGFRLIFTVRDLLMASSVPDSRVVAEGYGGAAWPAVHYRELEQLKERWQPYVYFRQTPFRGKTITIDDDGLRRTWQSSGLTGKGGKRRLVKILALGGSSLWGFGAKRPDDSVVTGSLARRKRLACRAQESGGNRLREHAGSDRADP